MYRTWPDREKAVNDIARALSELPVELTDGTDHRGRLLGRRPGCAWTGR